jgi:hypothetical protein
MRRLVVALSVGVLLAAAGVLAQGSLLVGTWKVNVAKSKYSPGPPSPPTQTLIWRSVQGGLEFTVNSVGTDGKPTKAVTLEKSDGSYAPVQGGTTPTMRHLRRIDDHTYEDGDTVNGKATISRRIVIARDARSITVTMTGTSATGQAVNNVVVYEKQ